jgi:hypothetical protein
MEIYVMKKKFVLTLALVLVVAGTLVAATPLEVSGSFETGYAFQFNPQKVNQDPSNAVTANINAAFTGDFWKVTLDGNFISYGEDDSLTGTAELYLDKALAEQGMDMGDLALTLHVGDGVSGSAPSVLADANDYRDGLGLEMATTGDNFGVTVKYADMVEVYASVDPTLKALPMVVGAKLMPIDGVEAAVGFTNDFDRDNDSDALPNNSNNGFAVSAKADVAALAGLNFALAATGEFLLDIEDDVNMITADVVGDYEGIGLMIAYQNDYNKANTLAAKASYSTTVSDFDLSASFKADLGVIDTSDDETYTIGAGAAYAMGGVTYALDAEYVFDGAFTLSPSVSISF